MNRVVALLALGVVAALFVLAAGAGAIAVLRSDPEPNVPAASELPLPAGIVVTSEGPYCVSGACSTRMAFVKLSDSLGRSPTDTCDLVEDRLRSLGWSPNQGGQLEGLAATSSNRRLVLGWCDDYGATILWAGAN